MMKSKSCASSRACPIGVVRRWVVTTQQRSFQSSVPRIMHCRPFRQGFSRSHLQRRSRVRICVRAQVRPGFRLAGTMPVRIRARSAPFARFSAVGGGWASSRMEWAIGSAVVGDGLRCWAERRSKRGCAGPSHLCFGRSRHRLLHTAAKAGWDGLRVRRQCLARNFLGAWS
jgi:hypothetical protein